MSARSADRTAALREALADPEWPGDARIAGWWVWGQCAWIGSGWCSKVPHVSDAGMGVAEWFRALSHRLARVRIIHGDWTRTLNHHYGGDSTALFFDPPYVAYEALYRQGAPVALKVAAWAREHPHLRIALCGHRGDYDLPGWDVHEWTRDGLTYGSDETRDEEAIWFSPACLGRGGQLELLR